MNFDQKSQKNQTGTTNSELITITVCSQSLEDLHFKVKKSYPIKKVFEKYCQRMEISNPETIRFIYEGDTVDQSKSVEQLGLVNLDKIEAVQSQVGGHLKILIQLSQLGPFHSKIFSFTYFVFFKPLISKLNIQRNQWCFNLSIIKYYKNICTWCKWLKNQNKILIFYEQCIYIITTFRTSYSKFFNKH